MTRWIVAALVALSAFAAPASAVDAEAVAEALLRHPGTRRAIVPTRAVSRPGARIRRDGDGLPRD